MKVSNKDGKESTCGSCGYWEHICWLLLCCGMRWCSIRPSQPVLRDLGGIQQATKRFRLGCAALGVCCVPDYLNADLERGWIVLMVARSNRQRSDRQRKRLSVFILASLPRELSHG